MNDEFHPRRALLHPLWLAPLALLGVNDHLLKGAQILPDTITGKLSDVAGLLVAPLLLAALLRIRSRRGWIAAHAVVGAIFAGIQVSAVAAAAWAGLMATVAFAWVITPDPTDLLALPALLLSAWLFPRVASRSTTGHLRSSAQLAVGGAGLLLCAATGTGEVTPPLFTDVWLHNATDHAVVVRIRPLKASVDVDCDVVEDDPGHLLSEPLFGDARAWTLNSRKNLSVRRGIDNDDGTALPSRECNVALVDVDGVAPAVFFWRDDTLEQQEIDSVGWHDDIEGGVMIDPVEPGSARFARDSSKIVHTLATLPAPSGGACAAQAEGGRIAWSEAPRGTHQLGTVDEGADGCLRLGLLAAEAPLDAPIRDAWYLCVPSEVFVFEAGAQITIEEIDTGASTGLRIVADTGAALWVYVGGLAPATGGVKFSPVPDYGCALRAEPECGTISRSSVIFAGGDPYASAEVPAGAKAVTLDKDDGSHAVVYVAHAQERVAVDAECAGGPDTIGDDVEVAVALIPTTE